MCGLCWRSETSPDDVQHPMKNTDQNCMDINVYIDQFENHCIKSVPIYSSVQSWVLIHIEKLPINK